MRNRSRPACSAVLLLLWLLPVLAAAAPAGEVTHVSGVCMVRKADGSSKVLAPKTLVEQGDVVVTSYNAYVRLKFTDGGEVTLRPNTQLRIERYHYEPTKPQEDSLVFGLLKGGLRTITGLIGKRQERTYQLQTTTATVGIRGTEFGLLECHGVECGPYKTVEGNVPRDGLHSDVTEGSIVIATLAGELVVKQGQYAYAARNDALPMLVPRTSAVPINPVIVRRPPLRSPKTSESS